MISPAQRRIFYWLYRLKLWTPYDALFHCGFRPKWGTRWIYEWMLRTQKVDDLKHAPMCPANHWCRRRIVYQYCNCGAVKYSKDTTK